jgi:predicted PurR-regulated permease PerM
MSPESARVEFTYRAVVALTLAAALFLAWKLGSVLMLVFGGVVIAVVIRLAADALARRLPIAARWGGLLVVLAIIAILGVTGYFFGNEIASQFGQLRSRLPGGLQRLREWFDGGGGAGAGAAGQLSLSNVMNVAGTTVTFATDLILVVLVAVYLSFNPGLYVRGALALVPAGRRDKAELALSAAGIALRGWLKGQLVSMATVGVLTGLGLWLIGVPLAFALGLIAAVLEFVPIIGPFLAAVPGILLALSQSTTTALYAALVYLVVQQLESNVITPIAQRWAVRLPPALVMVAIVGFGVLFGLPGLLFGAPLTVVIMAIVKRLYLKEPVI